MSAASTPASPCGSAQGKRKKGVWPLRMYSSALCCGIPGLLDGAREEIVRAKRELMVRRRRRRLERVPPAQPDADALAAGHLEIVRNEGSVARPAERLRFPGDRRGDYRDGGDARDREAAGLQREHRAPRGGRPFGEVQDGSA